MSVQTVFRFFEGEVYLEVVHHGIRDFFATVSREAVADLAVSRSKLQKGVVDLERKKVALLRVFFAFLAHGDPDVAVKNICVLDGFLRIVEYAVLRAVLLEERLHFVDDGSRLFKTLRASEREVHAELCAKNEEGVGDVVAVTDKGNRFALEVADLFLDGLGECEGLARMGVVGQGVYDRNVAVFGELLDEFLFEAANDESIDPAGKARGYVMDAFTLAETDRIRCEQNGGTAELVNADLESRNRAERRFLKEHANRLTVESIRELSIVDFFFQAHSNVDRFEDAFLAPVGET